MNRFENWFETPGNVTALRTELSECPAVLKALEYLVTHPYNHFEGGELHKSEPSVFAYALGYAKGQSDIIKELTGMATPRNTNY